MARVTRFLGGATADGRSMRPKRYGGLPMAAAFLA